MNMLQPFLPHILNLKPFIEIQSLQIMQILFEINF